MDAEKFMNLALLEAQKAFDLDEVPVGAVVVDQNGTVISRAHNLKESTNDPLGHAEVRAIRFAADKMGFWRLNGCTLYVTLEPCMMCTGALIQSRIDHVVFGAKDPKGGFVESLENGLSYPLNHKADWTSGVLELECSQMLKDFFKEKRKGR